MKHASHAIQILFISLAVIGVPSRGQVRAPTETRTQLLNSCKLAAGDDATESTEFEEVEACASRLMVARRVPESIAMAEWGLALALKQSGEQSEDYVYALNIHAQCVAMTGNVTLAHQEMQRAERISATLQKK